MFRRLRNWMLKQKAKRVLAAVRKQIETEKQLGIAPSKEELAQEQEEILSRLEALGVKVRRAESQPGGPADGSN